MRVTGRIGGEVFRQFKFIRNLLEPYVDPSYKVLCVLVLLHGGLIIPNDVKHVFIRCGVFDSASVNNLS